MCDNNLVHLKNKMHPTMVVSINIGVHKFFYIEIEWIECCSIILSFQGSEKKTKEMDFG
jgi:hypothetical protein